MKEINVKINVKVLVICLFKFAALIGVFWGFIAGVWNHWDSNIYAITSIYCFVFRLICSYYINKHSKINVN